jgi:hypothetical protein
MSFDLDFYRQTVAPVLTDDIDFTGFERRPLSSETLRVLRYMHDVESHTVCYLRDLLLTSGHQDPTVTTFLTLWNYEEFWHGVALGRVLTAHGEPAEDARIAPMRERLGWKNKLSPAASGLGSALLGVDFVALHMTWGAVNEWSTAAAYDRLSRREGHPVLSILLGRIARQESRHIAFYTTQARTRLARSARARTVTRWALRHLWAPVGSPVMPVGETQFVLDHLMGDTAGRRLARQIDRRVASLPGMAGLSIVESALDRRGIVAPAPAEQPDGGHPVVSGPAAATV